jgi:altronate dehydratase large subunit
MMGAELLGYLRPDGTVGVRNHVLVVSSMDVTNPLARRIAAAVEDTVSVTTSFGRIHEGADRAQHERTLAGLIRNPNTAAALVVGFEPDTTMGVVEALGACGKPVEALSVLSDGSTTDLVREGARIAAGMAAEAGRMARMPLPLSSLVLGLKCGGSDPTSGLIGNAAVGRVSDALVEAGGTVILTETEDMVGAEHLLAARAATPEIGDALCAAVSRLEQQALAHGAQLSALGDDHIAYGITTTEEKALGSIQKAGRSALQEVIRYAERPTRKGLVFMDAVGGGIPEITGLAAAGAQVILFLTGSGHPTGHPVAPTIKITGNPRTAARMASSIDVDVSPALAGEISLEDAAERIQNALLAVCAGQKTRNEQLGDVESTVPSIHAWSQHLIGMAS